MCWVYRKNTDGSFTVGYYVVIVDAESTIRCNWIAIEDSVPEGYARRLVNYLNGGLGDNALTFGTLQAS